MKKVKRYIFLGALVTLLLCGIFFSCDTKNQGTPGQGETIETEDGVKSSLSREMNPQLGSGELEELVAGNTAFALDLFARVRGGDENIFFSPYSISVALAMAYAGAKANSAAQMANVLHFTLAQERLHNAFNALDLELARRGQGTEEEEFQLSICNAAWGQQGYNFLQSYLDVLALNYGSGLRLLDFLADPEGCRQTINDWVSEQTEERIKDLLPDGAIQSNTRLVLTNAIYFKAGWLYPFPEENTGAAPFFGLDGQESEVDMMFQEETFAYTETTGYFQAIELLYKGREVSMVILLPAVGRFKEFEAALDADFLKTILGNLAAREVYLRMPRFTFEWQESLPEILKSLGMTDAFKPGQADFSGMDGTYDLYISDVLHKAFVALDEKGTEATAATAVVIGWTSMPGDPVSMTINRPFIFLIRDRATGTILFLGRVLKP